MNKEKGVSIIELLVAIGIFSMLITVITSIFINSMRSQTDVLFNQTLVGEMRYVVENISRIAMLAKTDESGTCVGFNQTYSFNNNEFRFIDYKNRCNIYSFENRSIYRRLIYNDIDVEDYITSPDIIVEEFNVTIMDDNHERVMLFIKMSLEGVETHAQTTFSKRPLR